jgi:hypothetical protein
MHIRCVTLISCSILQVAEHASDLRDYVEPAALSGDLPSGTTTTLDYVTKTEASAAAAAGSSSGSGTSHVSGASRHGSLSDIADSFLASGCQLLVLLGEAGSGKSTFMWKLCTRLLAGSPPGFLDVPVSRMASPVKPLYLPVYVELKRYKADGLAGLLHNALLSAGLSREAVQALRGQDTRAPLVRVVLLADGFDELQGDMSVFEDFVGTACGGWDPSLLAVIVTSRESRVGDRTREHTLFGGRHNRALLLPFTKDRVRACTVMLSWLQGCAVLPCSDVVNTAPQCTQTTLFCLCG